VSLGREYLHFLRRHPGWYLLPAALLLCGLWLWLRGAGPGADEFTYSLF
jgi:hypothetical protein